jgi:hypothetical protein
MVPEESVKDDEGRDKVEKVSVEDPVIGSEMEGVENTGNQGGEGGAIDTVPAAVMDEIEGTGIGTDQGGGTAGPDLGSPVRFH